MHVANNVKRPRFLLKIVMQRVAHYRLHGIYFFHPAQVKNVPETLRLERAQALAQQATVIGNDVGLEAGAVGALGVALLGHGLGHVEHDGHRQAVVLPGQRHESFAVFGAHVGGIHHGEAAALEALGHPVVQQLEGIVGGIQAVFVVRNQAPAHVGRHDFGGLEQAVRKRGLARPRAANEQY